MNHESISVCVLNFIIYNANILSLMIKKDAPEIYYMPIQPDCNFVKQPSERLTPLN